MGVAPEQQDLLATVGRRQQHQVPSPAGPPEGVDGGGRPVGQGCQRRYGGGGGPTRRHDGHPPCRGHRDVTQVPEVDTGGILRQRLVSDHQPARRGAVGGGAQLHQTLPDDVPGVARQPVPQLDGQHHVSGPDDSRPRVGDGPVAPGDDGQGGQLVVPPSLDRPGSRDRCRRPGRAIVREQRCGAGGQQGRDLPGHPVGQVARRPVRRRRAGRTTDRGAGGDRHRHQGQEGRQAPDCQSPHGAGRGTVTGCQTRVAAMIWSIRAGAIRTTSPVCGAWIISPLPM